MNKLQLPTFFLFIGFSLNAANIAITKIRDLTFKPATSQEAAEAVPPTSPSSSQFRVTGNPNTSFTLTLPSGILNMSNASNAVAADTWICDTSSPATLDATGTKIISLGATRSTIPTGGAAGLYTGTHSVAVRYSPLTGQQSAGASHQIIIMQSISLIATQGLSFIDAFPGDAAATVTPGGIGQAILQVQGQASTAYSITLPANNTVSMTRIGGSGGATENVLIQSFSSSPSGTGTLATNGQQNISVGAVRSAILPNQVVGTYSGSFTVRVTYQ